MLEFDICGITLRLYFGFFAAVCFSFFAYGADSLGIAAALVCCLLHELGHLAAMCLLSSPPEKICFYAGGIKIIPRRENIDRRVTELIILSAGCAVNFILAAVSTALGLRMLSELNLALGGFNLLPFSYLDGGRIIELYADIRLRKAISVFFGVMFTAAAASAVISGEKISPAAAAVIAFALFAEAAM